MAKKSKIEPGLLMTLAVFVVIPLAATISMKNEGARIRDSHSWVETPCVISESGYFSRRMRSGGKSSSRRQYYFPRVSYSYEFDGKGHESRRHKITESKYKFMMDVHRFQDSYPKGKLTSCYVNPQYPAESILELDSYWKTWAFVFPLVVTVGMGILFCCMLLRFLFKGTIADKAIARAGRRLTEKWLRLPA